jgi:Uma2 family endonuclease
MAFIMRASAKASGKFDPTIYPVEEKVGEDILQRWISELLRPLIERWFQQQNARAFVGADQFIYYGEHEPTLRVAPDIYVLPGVRPDTRVTSWKTWDKGIVPSFVLEIVSKDWEKDYVEAPEKYAAIGVPEVVIFDPMPARHSEGVTWQVFRRVGDRPLRRVEASQGDRLRSKALGCFLRVVGSGDGVRLRLGSGPRGDDLFPTAEEAERTAKEAAIVAGDAERAAKESERAAKDAAVAARDVALRRVLELESKLGRRRSRSR